MYKKIHDTTPMPLCSHSSYVLVDLCALDHQAGLCGLLSSVPGFVWEQSNTRSAELWAQFTKSVSHQFI